MRKNAYLGKRTYPPALGRFPPDGGGYVFYAKRNPRWVYVARSRFFKLSQR